MFLPSSWSFSREEEPYTNFRNDWCCTGFQGGGTFFPWTSRESWHFDLVSAGRRAKVGSTCLTWTCSSGLRRRRRRCRYSGCGDKLLPPIFIWVRLASTENAYNRKTVLPWSWLIIYRTFQRSCLVPPDVCQWQRTGVGVKIVPRCNHKQEIRLNVVEVVGVLLENCPFDREFLMWRENRKWQ